MVGLKDARVAIVGLGIICFAGALINMITIFSNVNFTGASPAAGLWIWAIAGLAAPILLLASSGPKR